jgi:hypothetical protein
MAAKVIDRAAIMRKYLPDTEFFLPAILSASGPTINGPIMETRGATIDIILGRNRKKEFVNI